MKHLIIIMLVFIGSVYTCKAQNAPELDEKNGFNKFHLGQNLNEVKAIAKIKTIGKDPENKHLTYYQVKDIGNFKIFEYPLKQIDLLFYDDELYCIGVTPSLVYTGEQNTIIYHDIFKRIQDQYGAFKEMVITAGDKLSGIQHKYELTGKKVLLRFSSGINSYSFYDIETRKKVESELESGL